jgi:diguanylate cyclase (GGDEF)-like protein/PAS domain S-box-containing protein
MIKRGFLSSAAIPIMKNGKVHAVLNIYASIPYFFEDVRKTILEELKHDLSFALEKIELYKESLILKNAVEKSTEWVLITDKNGNIEYVNDYVSKLTGYKKEELIGKNPRIFKSGYQPKEFYERMWKTILLGEEFEAIFVNKKKNGEVFYIEEKIIPVKMPDGEIKFVSIGRDITKETKLLKENERLRYYDVLTGLYNYNGFAMQVEDYIVNNPENLAALLLIDIANFSYINKTYGTEFGDELLKQIAKSLREHFKKEDIIARIGGDEFAVFAKDIKEKEDVFALVERVKNILDRDVLFKIKNIDINLTIHGGVAVYPDDGKTFKELLQNASVALKEAKKEGDNVVKIYNEEIEKSIKSFFSVGSLFNKAVRENLFIFHYQPYFDAKTKEIKGFEALVRIKDKDGKIYYPNEFIDFLENSHYLDYFREWALNEVSQKIKKWKKPISLNISARTFKNPDFPNEVFKYAKDLPAPLVLEITERLYMDELEKSKNIIDKLKECKNIKIAIDDFGTGYSSLSYLKDINADILKIDMSFVRAMVEDEKSKAIVKAIITLAKALNMKTLAEGVEIKEQYEMLKDMEVDYIQGFYLSKPLPEEEAEKLLK